MANLLGFTFNLPCGVILRACDTFSTKIPTNNWEKPRQRKSVEKALVDISIGKVPGI
ncbi:hypothetical protein Fmac_031998 [Flemingia macrophylla]|uniref:Uncharacterized protein n=1 Tax=Flemingia macrophylla TaxID=520843 RepID=A0ABD1L3N5_9FABA